MAGKESEPQKIGEDLAKTGAVIFAMAIAMFAFIGLFVSAPFRRN